MYSIVIANYNRTDELKRCLDSIDLAFNKFQRPEVIVVEDASTIKLDDARITKHITLKKNGGPVRARLEGSKYASFDYIILLDSDDTLLENAIATVEKNRANHPEFDVYGFTFKGGESDVEFDIQSIEDYCLFVEYEGRTSDYIIVIKTEVINKFILTHSYRLSEIWLFSELYKEHTCLYCKESIFSYHQDASTQLSKKRDFSLKTDKYERDSVSISVKYFISFISICKSIELKKAWRKRLFKETLLSLKIIDFIKILCLRK